MTTKFFYCKHCGNVVVKFVDSGVVPFCCGEEMVELKPNTFEGVGEKHVPLVERINDCTLRVKIGAWPHPMTKEHFICFVCVETKNGLEMKRLDHNDEPWVDFCICKEEPVAVYAYCNVHGLWKMDSRDLRKADRCETEKGRCCR